MLDRYCRHPEFGRVRSREHRVGNAGAMVQPETMGGTECGSGVWVRQPVWSGAVRPQVADGRQQPQEEEPVRARGRGAAPARGAALDQHLLALWGGIYQPGRAALSSIDEQKLALLEGRRGTRQK